MFWKPEFAWLVREILVLKPIRYFSILRNEVKSVASARTVRSWTTNGGGFFANADRTQRNTLALANVTYIIRADAVPKTNEPGLEAKYRDQFRRRVVRGQCFAQPYLGTREFTASFSEPGPDDRPLPISMDLGRMLHDLDYAAGRSRRAKPRFFDAQLVEGVLQIPALAVGAA